MKFYLKANDRLDASLKAKHVLYIEAYEDHVKLPSGASIELKLIYVHEGKKKISKND